MANYVMHSTMAGALNIIWTISTSDSNLDTRFVNVPEAKIGHLYFHLNATAARVQVWVLERKTWEEYEMIREKRNKLHVKEMIQEEYWLGLVSNACRH